MINALALNQFAKIFENSMNASVVMTMGYSEALQNSTVAMEMESTTT